MCPRRMGSSMRGSWRGIRMRREDLGGGGAGGESYVCAHGFECECGEAFEREIELNEPALELLAAKDADWHWLSYPFLREGDTVEKRRAVRVYLQAHQYRVAQGTLDWE